MIPPSVQIVGIAACEYDAEGGTLCVRLALSDGSTASSWWGADDLHRFMNVVSQPRHAPHGAAIN